MKQILENVTVLDFTTTVAGALTGAMMADHGATVIKVEQPGTGDPCRAMEPMVEGVSLMHCWVNRGKRSVTASLSEPKDRQLLQQLLADADVILESHTPGYMRACGLGYEDAACANPGVIYCSITAFGQEGPYRSQPANELIMQAMSGAMAITGYAGGVPQRHGINFAENAGAQTAYSAVMTALCHKELTGQGQHIDVPVTASIVWMNSAIDRINADIFTGPEGNHHMSLSPYGLFSGADGQSAIICALNPKIWNAICDVIGRPELAAAPEFSNVDQRAKNRHQVVEVIEQWLRTFDDIRDAIALMEQASIPCCQVNNIRDVLEDPHVKACGWLTDIPCPDSLQDKGIAHYRAPNGCAIYSETPPTLKKAADLGQDNALLGRYIECRASTERAGA